jgi:DEAD/DEAH box helicase domain-containing protein
MISELFFDIETKKLFNEIATDNPADLGISVVSVYRRKLSDEMVESDGEIMSFWEDDFPSMWQLFREATRIIGFNSLKFDVPALIPLAPYEISKLPHFDIMAKVREAIGRNISLNHLAEKNLSRTKTDIGTNAVLYWKKGDPESLSKLKYYCEQDVLITRDLYDIGLRQSVLKYTDQWNNLKDIPVDFTYPAEVILKHRQIGLF